jgi:hypothetical protein
MLGATLILALFTVGLVVPCVIDVATSPPWAVRTLSKRAWVVITLLLSVPGCVAWLLVGRPRRISLLRPGRSSRVTIGPAEAFRRHPAGRSMGLDLDDDPLYGIDRRQPPPPRPLGPDDDPEFLLELDRRIQELRDDC